jgi:uncharacterized protein YdaU (DUF1376 family)
MSQAPSMPMFWDAYIGDTTHLTIEEHGAYLLLLGAMWRRNGWVPDDDRDIARILGITAAKWRKIKHRIGPFLTFRNGQISQKNLLKIWKNTQEKIEKNRKNGAKGGRPKPSENNNLGKADGSVSLNPIESIPEPEPEPEEEVKDKSSTSSQSSSENLDGLYDDVLSAAGIKSGVMSQYWMPPAAIVHVNRWVTDLGLTRDQVIETVQQKRKGFDAPPNGPKAFDFAMMNYAAALKAPAMQPSASRKQVDGYRATDPELAMSNAAMRKKMENYRLELERQSLAEWQTAGAGTA